MNRFKRQRFEAAVTSMGCRAKPHELPPEVAILAENRWHWKQRLMGIAPPGGAESNPRLRD